MKKTIGAPFVYLLLISLLLALPAAAQPDAVLSAPPFT